MSHHNHRANQTSHSESEPSPSGNPNHESPLRAAGISRPSLQSRRAVAQQNRIRLRHLTVLHGQRLTSKLRGSISRLQLGGGPSARYQRFPTHGTFRNGAPLRGMIPNCGLSSLVLTAYGGSRGAAVYPRVRRSQSRPKPNGHAPDPRVAHGQHPFSYRWTAASSSFSSATVRSIMPCAKSSIGNPSTRR